MNHESGDLPKNCSIISGLGNKVHNSKNVVSVHFMAFSGSGKGFFYFLQFHSRIFVGNLPAASSRRCRVRAVPSRIPCRPLHINGKLQTAFGTGCLQHLKGHPLGFEYEAVHVENHCTNHTFSPLTRRFTPAADRLPVCRQTSRSTPYQSPLPIPSSQDVRSAHQTEPAQW